MIESDEILTVACLRPMLWENGLSVSKLLRKLNVTKNLIFPFLYAFFTYMSRYSGNNPSVKNQVSHAVVGAYRLTMACSLAQRLCRDHTLYALYM
jgi:hypothetical protein